MEAQSCQGDLCEVFLFRVTKQWLANVVQLFRADKNRGRFEVMFWFGLESKHVE